MVLIGCGYYVCCTLIFDALQLSKMTIKVAYFANSDSIDSSNLMEITPSLEIANKILANGYYGHASFEITKILKQSKTVQ